MSGNGTGTIAGVASLAELARRHSDLDSLSLAKLVVREMTASQKDDLLLDLLKSHFDQIRRAEVHSIEKSSSLLRYEKEKQKRERENQRRRHWERQALKSMAAETPWHFIQSYQGQDWIRLPLVMKLARIAREEPDFAAWLKRKGVTDIDSHAHSSYRLEIAQQDFKRKIRRKVKLELKRELLQARFALPDGRSVTWGEATAADHQSRIAYLLTQAGGTVATANRHKAAIEILRQHHAHTLNQVALQTMRKPAASETQTAMRKPPVPVPLPESRRTGTVK